MISEIWKKCRIKEAFFSRQDIMRIDGRYQDYLNSGRYDFRDFIGECVQKWYLNEQKRRMEMIHE